MGIVILFPRKSEFLSNMKIRVLVYKLFSGFARYGFFRTLAGMVSLTKLKVQKPDFGVVTTGPDSLTFHFKFPEQCMPSLVVYRQL